MPYRAKPKPRPYRHPGGPSLLVTGERERAEPGQKPYTPRGASLEAFYAQDDELLIAGPAGTGKSRGLLEKLHIVGYKYPGARMAIVRKTRRSLTQSAMVTFERYVLPDGSPIYYHHTDSEYRWPNGSVAVVSGIDEPSRLLSTDFDIIYVQEANELRLEDWETLSTRLRAGALPYAQLIGDVNPQGPYHWLYKRWQRGAIKMLKSVHKDNPALWNEERQEWTPLGIAYLRKLNKLTGVRLKRLAQGLWVQAEGMVYEMWQPDVHWVPRFAIPMSWPRYRVIDFGYQNPFVCQWWALSPDGELYMYRELYGIHKLVEDWARAITGCESVIERKRIIATICDHDAQARATLEKHLNTRTVPAKKNIPAGIQKVSSRLRFDEDQEQRPRLFIFQDALIERDSELDEAGLPASTVEEFDSYIWDDKPGKAPREYPVDKYNHGMDCVRYMVNEIDSDLTLTQQTNLDAIGRMFNS